MIPQSISPFLAEVHHCQGLDGLTSVIHSAESRAFKALLNMNVWIYDVNIASVPAEGAGGRLMEGWGGKEVEGQK